MQGKEGNETGANHVEAIETTLSILSVLQEEEGAGVTEIANSIGRSKGTVYNHLSTLRQHDYVVKDDDVYQLGFRFIEVSYRAKRRLKILDIIREQIDKIARETGEMALFQIEEHGFGVCLEKALGENAVQTPVHVGYRTTLHDTAVGKAILAHLPEERVADIVERHGLPHKTEQTITDCEDLYAELERIRERGYATNASETITGLVGIGAPLHNQNNEVIGGISVIGPKSRLNEDDRRKSLAGVIRRSINVIEINSTSIQE